MRLSLLVLLVLLSSASVAGAGDATTPADCDQVSYGTSPPDLEAPPNGAGPTLVAAGFFVTELRAIDAVSDDFLYRGYVRLTWCDPRLAFEGSEERVLMGPAAEAELERIWFPAGFPVNGVGEFEVSERVVRIWPDGTVRHGLNVRMRLAADYDLHRFPFDQQSLEVVMESFRWPASSLVFVADPAHTGFATDFDIPDWDLVRVDSRVQEASVIRASEPFSRFALDLRVKRKSGFYLWKVILPLFVIVGLSWSVFWMTEERFAGRSRITATGVLTIVAYQFVVADDLPRVAYLTLIDKLMIVSFLLLAVTVLESLLVARHQGTEHAPASPDGHTRAKAIDRTARWFFPAVYAVCLGLIALTGR